jgi:HlyD family secretion protein
MAEPRRQTTLSRQTGRRGITSMFGVTAAALAVLIAAGSGAWWWLQHRGATDGSSILLHTVEPGDFELTVTERGEVESDDVTEVRSLVKSNNTAGMSILRIVPEGTEVKKGDFLVELDSSALNAERLTQQVAVNTAQAAVVEAHNLYETAVISKQEYLEGTYVQERQTVESTVFVAEENLNRAKEYYSYSQKLAAKGYVNQLQLEADRFAVEKAKKELDAANTQLKVLDEFTKAKMLMQLESDIRIAEAKWEAAKNSYELEAEKLRDIQDQIAKCMIVAPQAGVVKYAHETDRHGQQEFIVEEGVIVRERQTIIRLPNADSMVVRLTINESLIQYVRPGLPATISPVGLGDRTFKGTVEKVNQYAEPTGFLRANVKEYKAYVSVDEATSALRSGMTASVTIRCARVPNALQVPVQAIYAHGNKVYCFVYNGGSWKAREIKPGPTNDKFFVVENGLQAGDRVALSPRRFVDQVDLPKLRPEVAQRAIPQGPADMADSEAGGQPPVATGDSTRRAEQPGFGLGRQGPPGQQPPGPGPAVQGPPGQRPAALRQGARAARGGGAVADADATEKPSGHGTSAVPGPQAAPAAGEGVGG